MFMIMALVLMVMVGDGILGIGTAIDLLPLLQKETLYIDLIDAYKKELVWQGIGTGYLTKSMNKKEERIKEFVSKIMEKYPPQAQ